MRGRGIALPLVLVGAVASGLGLAAVVDRSPLPARSAPGFGAEASGGGNARTEAWAEVAGFRAGLDPGSANACERGDPACLDAVVGEMEARVAELGCAHTAPFAFTYLEMTKGVQRRSLEPGFFAVPAGTVNFDAVFARLYFDAIDHWEAGRREQVTGAWQVAFQAAEGGRTSTATDLLLGMNAHISRDLAYVVAGGIAAAPELATDSADFDRINSVIGEVKSPMLAGSAQRFDPGLAALDRPLPAVAGSPSVDIIAVWRNQALRNGRRLAAAPAEGKAAVAAAIDREAVANAAIILNAGAATPGATPGAAPGADDGDRDGYCAGQRVS